MIDHHTYLLKNTRFKNLKWVQNIYIYKKIKKNLFIFKI